MSTLERIADFLRPTGLGVFNMVSYSVDGGTGGFAFALTKGALPQRDLLVRVQSACMFGESFGVTSCDCGDQLRESLRLGAEEETFALIYMQNQEGRGLGMLKKIQAIEIEAKKGVDMVEAFERLDFPIDVREYTGVAEIIKDINADLPVRLMTNNPKKVSGLRENGVHVSERVPLLVEPTNESCRRYLHVKKHRLGHILPHVD